MKVLLERGSDKQTPDDIILFSIVRNEALRLPFFFDHYTKLGVNKFFIVDNGSKDNSIEIFETVENISVFSTTRPYKEHWYWMEWLLDRFGENKWCVVVDADEIFSLPNSTVHSLRGLIEKLKEGNCEAVRCILLDMYAKDSFHNLKYQAGEDPFKNYTYFDKEGYYAWDALFTNRQTKKSYPFKVHGGGMRSRVFDLNRNNILTKVPLFFNKKETYLSQGMHAIDGNRLAPVEYAVFHFKYLQDFMSRANEEAERQQHAFDAAFYKVYADVLNEGRSDTFYNPEISVKYKDYEQLQALGLVNIDPEFI